MRPFLRLLSVISALALLTTGATAEAPPTDSAVLWSDDADECTIDAAETDAFGELADCTDITYTGPSTAAEEITRESFEGIDSRGSDESVYPNGATLTSSGPIREAHATIFSVGPSTLLHVSPNETMRYVAPEGRLRTFVDYRIELPDPVSRENETITWDLKSESVESVRFGVENETRDLSRSSTPVFDYSLTGTGNRTLWVEATIAVTVEKTSERETENQTITETTESEYRVTVRDAVEGRIYRPSYDVAVATTPTETGLVAVSASQPYVGYTVANNGDESVRTNWRFYTTSSDDWRTLTTATETNYETASLRARPIVVHAYPARSRPTAAPFSRAIRVQTARSTWTESTAPNLPSTISVDTVELTYRRPTTVVSEHDHPLADELSIRGLVAGTAATVNIKDADHTGELRPTAVETTVISKNETAVVLSVVVRDNTTDTRIYPRSDSSDSVGVLVRGNQSYPIDLDGMTAITVPTRGVSVVSFQPEGWDGDEVTYLPSTTHVAFHPLTDLGGWVTLGVSVLKASAPFVVVFIGGRQLGRLYRGEDRRW